MNKQPTTGFLSGFCLCLCLLLSSCVAKHVNLMQEPDKHIPHYADTLPYADYKIHTNDRLDIRVYSVDEQVQRLFNASGMSGSGNNRNVATNAGYANELYTYLVMDDGTIEFPLVGKIPVKDMTTREVKLVLEDALAEYIRDYGDYKMVSVDVNVVQRMFSVICDGGSSSLAMRREKMTIFEALAMAPDLGDWSDRAKVRIVREVDGQTKVIMFDLRSKDIVNSEYYYIEPNDVIYVQQRIGKPFGVNNVLTAVGVVTTTVSFGLFIYAIVQRSINASKSGSNSK